MRPPRLWMCFDVCVRGWCHARWFDWTHLQFHARFGDSVHLCFRICACTYSTCKVIPGNVSRFSVSWFDDLLISFVLAWQVRDFGRDHPLSRERGTDAGTENWSPCTLSREYVTYNPVKARFWPWLSGTSLLNPWTVSRFVRKRSF